MTPTLAAWLHDLSPFLLDLGGWGIRYYGLSYALGFLLAWLILRALARRHATPLSEQRVADAMLLLIIGAVVGGRLGYILVYDPSILTLFSPRAPWWGPLMLNHGGMASHGGMIGVVLATFAIARGPKAPDASRPDRVPFLHVWDLVAIATPLGLMLGRLANFINGELLGKIVAPPGSPAPSWAVRFPQELLTPHAPPLTPDQTAALANLLATYAPPADPALASPTLVQAILQSPNPADRDALFPVVDRILHLLQTGSHTATQPIREALGPLLAARHPSQLYQAFAEGVVLGTFMLLLWLTPRRPGIIAAWFLIAYGMLRITTEFYRLPDAHLAVQRIAGLSRGQWLSAGMILAGAVVLLFALRSARPAMGGLLRPAHRPTP